MNVQFSKSGNVTVVSVTGRIDFVGAAAFRQALHAHLDECVEQASGLLLNLSAVDYVSSSGLRELLIAAKRVATGKGRMVVCCLQPMVKEVIRISRFDLVLSLAENEADARRMLKAGT